jgi:hypothetical protein
MNHTDDPLYNAVDCQQFSTSEPSTQVDSFDMVNTLTSLIIANEPIVDASQNDIVRCSTTTTNVNVHNRQGRQTEKCVLNQLNDRFITYLEQIKELANYNRKLRTDIDTIRQEKLRSSCSSFDHFSRLSKQINDTVQEQFTIQLCLQRADHDRHSYENLIKMSRIDERTQNDTIIMFQYQLQSKCDELEQLIKQCKNREDDLKVNDRFMNRILCSIRYRSTTSACYPCVFHSMFSFHVDCTCFSCLNSSTTN